MGLVAQLLSMTANYGLMYIKYILEGALGL
jgi:hypothetical protein